MGLATSELLASQRKEIELAADRLDARVKKAAADLETDSYWAPYDKETAWHDGFTNGMGGECSELAGILTPHVMSQMVRLMRAEVRDSVTRSDVSPYLLVFARGINAQVEACEGKR